MRVIVILLSIVAGVCLGGCQKSLNADEEKIAEQTFNVYPIGRVVREGGKTMIAISRCEVLSVRDNIIEIKDIDAFDNTPVIDLKGDFFYYYKPAVK